ncbi:Na+/H+ antiporter NhaA [Modicisalibacter xianhensis]|uniref:Na(+)/H(+) antiporter NhaA n=1 Tax=Modicisalibacter xianhensis TaxID=442341 RepID=A0A1I3D5L8_9GAMM|nr:Na+/H+ antiporter NhaA [Halomonas xianhensis]SFH81985.1 sodium/proton antiporter, NhaA family [Halomonas xianhensis]
MVDQRKNQLAPPLLPKGYIDRIARPFSSFLKIESAGGGLLLLFTLVALALSNSPWAPRFEGIWETSVGIHIGSLESSRTIRGWINDALMTLFFFLVALELKRELVLGELRKPRVAALPIIAALGGMAVPPFIYLALQAGQPGQHGWGTVMATDTAFVIGCLALLGPRVPQSLRLFMLSLAIIDDIGAILVVAIAYSDNINWLWLLLAVFGLLLVRAMAMLGLRGLSHYFLLGALIWLAVDASGIHPTITGVILGLMTPARRWVSDERLYAILGQVVSHPANSESSKGTQGRETLQVAAVAARESLSPVERLEIALHPWVGFFIMPLFALTNAGFPFAFSDFGNPVTVAVFSGFVFGKPIGILLFSWLAVRLYIASRPPELTWELIAGGSLLAGIGFTMSLFIAGLAFGENLINSAKLGIFLASVFSAVTGISLLFWLHGRSNSPTFNNVNH